MKMNQPGKNQPPIKHAPEGNSLAPAAHQAGHAPDSASGGKGTSEVINLHRNSDADMAPLLDQLRALPAILPSAELTDRVARAALAELPTTSATKSGVGASNRPPAEIAPGWRSYLEFALYRAALPSALAGATVVYLSWAISAASHLY